MQTNESTIWLTGVYQAYLQYPHLLSTRLWSYFWFAADEEDDDVPQFRLLTDNDWNVIIGLCKNPEEKLLLENIRVLYS